jgi:hypothetical protein
MYYKITVAIFIALICVGCNQEINIEISSESFTEKELKICENTKCPEVTINYVEVFGDKDVSEKNKQENKKLHHKLTFNG